MQRRTLIVALATALTGCTVGPDYKRPSVAVPAGFRAPERAPVTQTAALADLKWFEIFKDDRLQELIRTALQQNYDLRDAVARVEAAAS
jgi:multidrug efflux system outer membrane protein